MKKNSINKWKSKNWYETVSKWIQPANRLTCHITDKQKGELFSFQILSKVHFRAYFVSIPIHFLITFKFKRFPSFELPVPIPSVQPVERMSSRRTSEPGVIKSQTAV